MARKKMNFENAMEELQVIYDDLEHGAVGLDDLEKKMKRVNELTTYCKEKLRDISSVLKTDDTPR